MRSPKVDLAPDSHQPHHVCHVRHVFGPKTHVQRDLAVRKIDDHLATDGTIDYNQDGWKLQSLRHHTLFVRGNKFPDPFIDNFYIIFKMFRDGDSILAPDGKNVSGWMANPRPSLIGDGLSPNLVAGGHRITERQLYKEFEL